MANSFFIKDEIYNHFKENALSYYMGLVSLLVGLILGLYLSFTDFNYISLLSGADKNMFDFITGTASLTTIFYSRLADVLICLIIIFVFNLIIYTSFLSYIFLGYQMMLMVLSCAAVITMYGITGVINVILLVLPVNLVNLFIMMITIAVCHSRAKLQSKYKLKFFESFKEFDFWKKFLICFILLIIVCIIHSFILPLFVKSFIVVNY